MSSQELPDVSENSKKIAAENCCVEQVVNSIFEHVVNNPEDSVQHRSDSSEINRFSNELVEGELIFGSPDEAAIEQATAKIERRLRRVIRSGDTT